MGHYSGFISLVLSLLSLSLPSFTFLPLDQPVKQEQCYWWETSNVSCIQPWGLQQIALLAHLLAPIWKGHYTKARVQDLCLLDVFQEMSFYILIMNCTILLMVKKMNYVQCVKIFQHYKGPDLNASLLECLDVKVLAQRNLRCPSQWPFFPPALRPSLLP